MAVVNIREVYPGVSLGLWQMDEEIEQLFELYPHLQAYRSSLDAKYKNDGKKLKFPAIILVYIIQRGTIRQEMRILVEQLFGRLIHLP